MKADHFPVAGETWLNLKKGLPYEVVAIGIDADNATAGRKVVIYRNREGTWYSRSLGEFLVKFGRSQP